MAQIDIETLKDSELLSLVKNRWDSSDELWDVVKRIYKQNTAIYENSSKWLDTVAYSRKNFVVQANRIFPNMEAVVNSLIANPPGMNLLPARKGEEAQDTASRLENYFRKKYLDRNLKETVRMGLRNLYFARLIVIKPFWNSSINDFDFRAIDPRNVRVSRFARKEQDSEFAIEEIEDNLCSVIERFPSKKEELMKKYGINNDTELYIKNPDVKYKESWIQDYVIFTLDTIVLGKIKNPYWDFEGILVTEEEETQLEDKSENGLTNQQRRELLQNIKLEQEQRKSMMVESNVPEQEGNTQYKPYLFNHFESVRKPYIIATIFNNENSPIGRTDMITLAKDLQRGIDKRKMDIDENCELANGIVKVDASVMGKSDAQRIRFETRGIIWGKGVKDGVTRETGQALPEMVFNDMIDSRNEIDNIMAATSAFKGEREGQETKAGRLALIQQSYLRLNELVQVVDYVYKEIFDWSMQFAKTRYTEYHQAKFQGKDNENEAIEVIQDDIESGSEVVVIAGKTLPVDDEFKFEQAQNDVKEGYISPVDYLRIAKYDDYNELSKNAVAYKLNPVVATNMTPEEQQELQPETKEEKPPNISISYSELPPTAQQQLLQKINIQVDPEVLVAEKILEHSNKRSELERKTEPKKE